MYDPHPPGHRYPGWVWAVSHPGRVGFFIRREARPSFAYELLYHPLAWSYDWVAALVSAGKWRDWVLTSLPYLKWTEDT